MAATASPGDAEPTATPATSTGAKPIGEFSCDRQERAAGSGTWFLAMVRTGSHVSAVEPDEGFDRVVFEVEPGTEPTGTPGVIVASASPPFLEDPSGNPVDVGADKAILVTLTNATGVDLAATPPTPVYAGPKKIGMSGTGPVVSVVEAGDFEATMNWYIGLEAEACTAVGFLADPMRVVVEVKAKT